MKAFFFSFLLSSALVFSASAQPQIAYKELERLAIGALGQLQKTSIKLRTEFCGDVLLRGEALVLPVAVQGNYDSCQPNDIPKGADLVASYHTHGNHDRHYWGELPSIPDFEGAVSEQAYNFIGTPGGRVWMIDPFQKEIVLVCNGCIIKDPRYDPRDVPRLPRRLNFTQLKSLLAQ